MLGRWGVVIDTLEVAPLFPNIDLSTTKGCSFLLESMIFAELRRISNPSEDAALDKEWRLTILPQLPRKNSGGPALCPGNFGALGVTPIVAEPS
jgi:hypothetical protein